MSDAPVGTRVEGPVRFEHRDDGLGLGTATPRLSWRLVSDDPAFQPTGAEIELTPEGGEPEVVRRATAEQVLVPWPFRPLTSRQRATVRVRVTDGQAWTPWSEASPLEAGLLSPGDWAAQFVSPRRAGASAPVLRRVVRVRATPERARLYVTAHGVYQATVNGTRVGDEVLAPGWTSYHHRLRYQTHDVTGLLQPGDNVLEVLLGNGWYRGRLGFAGQRALYGDRLALLAQLEVTYPDGTVERVGTDEAWTAHESRILADDLYDGQRTDLRRPAVGPDPAEVEAVETADAGLARLVAPTGPPVRPLATVPAVAVVGTAEGETVVDFGQNVVGWVRLRVRGAAAGDEVRVRHAEVVEDGRLALRPLRTAQATDTYVLAGGDQEVLEPCFTLHGFRYAGITGTPDVAPADVEAVVVGSDLTRTGWFSSSDPDLDRLHENVVWSMRGNFVDVPTDCPQRDERLGWTGDLQVFAPTAGFLFDCAGLLEGWLADLAAEQRPDGTPPMVVPDVLGIFPPVAGWGDAAVIVPWVVYERFGDRSLLERQFDSMRRWVDRARSLTDPEGVWAGGFQLGDWLDPAAPPTRPWEAAADPDVVATAYLARSTALLAQVAEVLGRTAEAERARAEAEETRLAFGRAFVTPAGRILSDCPTVYALALAWDLLPSAEVRAAAGRRLADLVRAAGFQVSTGFLGTPLIADALCRAGEPGVAYRLLLERGCPSWLYPVTMGATTVWERWDSLLPDGSVNPGEMTSFNHYAFGAVADWLHRSVAGLAPAAPGYREVTVAPVVDGALTAASARHLSPYGEIAVAWRRIGGRLHLELTVPVGVTAVVQVPGAADREVVGHGRHRWEADDPVATADGLPAGATLRQVVDDPKLFDAVVDLLLTRGLGATRSEVARCLLPHLDRRVDSLPVPLGPAALMVGAVDISERIAALVSGD